MNLSLTAAITDLTFPFMEQRDPNSKIHMALED